MSKHLRAPTRVMPDWATRKFALAALIASSCVAFGDAHSDAERIEKISVVASRMPVDTIGVESIDLDEFAPHFSLANILSSVTGTALSQSGGIASLTQTRVRGAEANHVKVLLNGVPLNLESGDFNWATISPIGITRLDALNGPRSAVWGNHALAGVVHFSAMVSEPVNRIYFDTGNQASWNIGGDAAISAFDTPISIHISKRASEGTNTSYEGDETDGFEQDALHVGYERGIGQLLFEGFARHTNTVSEYDPIPRDGDFHNDATSEIFAQRVSWNACDTVFWRFNASQTKSELKNFKEDEETNSWRGDLMLLSVEGEVVLSERQRGALVVERMQERFAQRGSASFFGDPNYDESMDSTALAGEYHLAFKPFELHASVRRDANGEFGDSTAWHASALQRLRDWRWSYSVGVGVKNPTFIERFGYTPDSFFGNANLKPETALQHQIALERVTADDTFMLAIYANVLDNEINGFTYDAERNQFTAVNKDEQSRRRGGELRYERSFATTSIAVNYAYVDSTESNEREIRRPEHLANLRVRQSISDRIRLLTALHWTSEQLDRDFSAFPAPIVKLDSFAIAHASLAFDVTAKLSLNMNVENLFDKDYQHVYGFRPPGRLFRIGAQMQL